MRNTVSSLVQVSLNNTHAHLATKVLNLDRAALKGHCEAALKLVFCSAELIWGHNAVQQERELMYEVWKDRSSCRWRE